jgi:hypothetical protein
VSVVSRAIWRAVGSTKGTMLGFTNSCTQGSIPLS